MAGRPSKRARASPLQECDWSRLDGAVLGSVFGFLSLGERLARAGAVCRRWQLNQCARWRAVVLPKSSGDEALRLALRAASPGTLEQVRMGRRVTDTGLAQLSGLTGLQRLNLSYCRSVTDAGMAHLSGLVGLQHLEISCYANVTDAGLAHVSWLQ